MELFERMKNIYGFNNEIELKKAIAKIKEELSYLTEERTCKIYSNYLLDELKKHHISARMINSKDLGFDYEHVFVLVLNNTGGGYLLADLTFSQFNSHNNNFTKLLTDGYQEVTEIEFIYYLSIISGSRDPQIFNLDSIFLTDNNFKR